MIVKVITLQLVKKYEPLQNFGIVIAIQNVSYKG